MSIRNSALFISSLLLISWVSQIPEDNLELPKIIEGDQIIEHYAYTLNYNEEYEQASWIAYSLKSSELKKVAKRSNRFKPDPYVKTKTPITSDYSKTGFDRGHLAPAADMAFSTTAMEESFFMSNISPQRPKFNRGIWKKLEAKVREWTSKEGELFIVTGPILSDKPDNFIGKTCKIAVPNYFYKALLDTTGVDKAIAFILPNRGSKLPLSDYVVSVDSLESVIGRDLFHSLPDSIEDHLEKSSRYTDWN